MVSPAVATSEKPGSTSLPSVSPGGPRSTAFAPSRSRIMLVEDDDDIREGLEALLDATGYEVRSFARGDAALAALSAEPPDLILLDLMMPGMNGWQFRVEQKKNKRLAEIPVVVLTADVTAYAAAIDADAFLAKPIELDELERVIERILVQQERKRLARRAVELERVRSLGMLVASVAHEINNPLTYLLGCLDLAEQDMSELASQQNLQGELVTRISANIESARDGANRVAATVRLISTFARTETEASSDVVNVNRAIRAAARLAKHRIEPQATLELELAELPPVHGSEARLAQVVLNLLVNAGQAIRPEATRAQEVRVRTACAEDVVTIHVSDTGRGMSSEVLGQIFEPFFTTKPPGEGTGLGLSISRDIIVEMGGTLGAESAQGVGSAFRITLPVSKTQHAHRPSQAPSPSGSGGENAVARRRVLVIDDEALIGRFVKAALPNHHVDVIADPSEALTRVLELDHDLILCDLRMPTMSGIALYHALVAVRPELKAAFALMSGASADPALDRFLETHDVKLLHKPFTLQALRALVASHDATTAAP